MKLQKRTALFIRTAALVPKRTSNINIPEYTEKKNKLSIRIVLRLPKNGEKLPMELFLNQ